MVRFYDYYTQTTDDIKKTQVNKTEYVSDLKNTRQIDITEYEKQTKNNDDSLSSFDDIDS